MKVFQAYPVWLPLTMRWLYNQIRLQPKSVENILLCDTILPESKEFMVSQFIELGKAGSFLLNLDKSFRKTGLFPSLRMLDSVLQTHQPDLLHSHFGHIGWENAFIAKKRAVRHVVSFYGNDVNQLPKSHPKWIKRYKNLFETVDGTLCEGPFMRKSLIQLGANPEQCFIQPIGIEVSEIAFKPRKIPNENRPLRILLASSFRQKKGIPLALEAVSKVKKNRPIQVTVIGDSGGIPESEIEKSRILESISRLGLTNDVHLCGFKSHRDMHRIALENDVFLAPSLFADNGDSEGGAPITILEMMASGMPVIGSTHCDIPFVLDEGKSGFLFEERNAGKLAETLESITDDNVRWEKTIKNARNRVELLFDARLLAAKLAQTYARLI